MSILLKTIRVFGYRGLKNIEVDFERVTVLTGMNNTGKTSLLKALQLAMGTRQYVSQEDFFISGNNSEKQIVIDIKIIATDNEGNPQDKFDDNWEEVFKAEKIKVDHNAYIPVRSIISLDPITNDFKIKKIILPNWPALTDKNGLEWHKTTNGKEQSFYYEELPFFYMDAQRDIVEDIKSRTSFLGKMISKIAYSKEEIEEIEVQIKKLNETAVSSSDILRNIKETLAELNTTMDTKGEGIEITPFTKKIRDLNKGFSVHYADGKDSFPMEYHGMGTRSWSSLLTLKSFILMLEKNATKNTNPFFPILAVEEPEAHIHPNAQKKLYSQLESLPGQIIISTHSPYIAASAELMQIRSFYKNTTGVNCGKVDIRQLNNEDIRKIKRQVLNTRGEMFFSKCLVFFEGETEEQSLPVFAKHFFKKPAFEFGIDFIGVGGHGNYLPFLRVAEALKIPWLIFSDAENKIKKNVEITIKTLLDKTKLVDEDFSNIVFLDDGNNFENQIISEDYADEIKLALASIHGDEYFEKYLKDNNGKARCRNKTLTTCPTCTQNIYEDVLRDYSNDEGINKALYDCMVDQKTKLGSVIGDCIINSGKPLPKKVIELFEKIKIIFDMEV